MHPTQFQFDSHITQKLDILVGPDSVLIVLQQQCSLLNDVVCADRDRGWRDLNRQGPWIIGRQSHDHQCHQIGLNGLVVQPYRLLKRRQSDGDQSTLPCVPQGHDTGHLGISEPLLREVLPIKHLDLTL